MPAIDVAHHLDVLKANITIRKEECYLNPATENERDLVVEEGYDEDTLNQVFSQFYGEY